VGGEANNYSGETTALDGKILLSKTMRPAIPGKLSVYNGATVELLRSEQISDTSRVVLGSYANLDLNGLQESIGSLESDHWSYEDGGRVLEVTNVFEIGDNHQSTVFDGVIYGSGGTNLMKVGNGELKLTANHPYTGKTVIRGGRLNLTGSISNSAVNVYAGGTLAGNGVMGFLSSSGGTIAPSGNGPAQAYGKLLTLGSVSLGSASKFVVDLGGTDPGVSFDQLEMASGSLTLPACSLVVTQNITGAVSNQYRIFNTVTGGASMGTFTGIAEGANVVSSSGRSFRVNYFAGAGNNDIVLTQLEALAAANITGIQNLAGAMQLSALGSPNGQYLVQANTNLTTTNWVDLGVITANGSGNLQYLDLSATNYPMRFYRFKAQ
jgi:autotransporter-associated beta strand protein